MVLEGTDKLIAHVFTIASDVTCACIVNMREAPRVVLYSRVVHEHALGVISSVQLQCLLSSTS